jgi:hypothetical protein
MPAPGVHVLVHGATHAPLLHVVPEAHAAGGVHCVHPVAPGTHVITALEPLHCASPRVHASAQPHVPAAHVIPLAQATGADQS